MKTIQINHQEQRRALNYSVVGRNQMENIFREIALTELREAEEDAIVNGDTVTSSSHINYLYSATDHPHGYGSTTNESLIMFNGLRKSATGTAVDVATATPTATNFRTAIKNLGKYGVDPKKVIFLVSTDMRTVMMGFTQKETLDKYGPGATILTGEVMKIYGSTVIVTDKLPNTASDTLTNTAGIRSSSTATNAYTEGIAVYIESPIIAVPSNPDNALAITWKAFPEFDRVHLFAREDIGFGVRWADAIVRIYGAATS